MGAPSIMGKDAATILAEVLARYEARTGVDLQPADPRRLHLQAIVLELVQFRALGDYAGKQSMLRYVDEDFIEALAELWGSSAAREGAVGSTTTLRWTAAAAGVHTIAKGKRATDGAFIWSVKSTTVSESGATYVDTLAECTTTGEASNDVAPGLIATMVDSIPGIVSVTNTTTTQGGADVEPLETYRQRLKDEPERSAVAGPRGAYRALALAASDDVLDARALGPNDAAYMAGYPPPTPGEVFVLVTEVDDITPSAGVLTAVENALSDEDVRPLGDDVTVKAPEISEYEISGTYYIGEDREDDADTIQAAVEDAVDAYVAWQSARIGRDINPDELIYRVKAAGAKRVVLTSPTFTELSRDEVAKLSGYAVLTFAGVEDE